MAEPPLSFKLDEQIHFLQVSGGSPFTLLKKKKRQLAPGQSKSGITLGFPIPSSAFFNSQPHSKEPASSSEDPLTLDGPFSRSTPGQN